MAATLRVLAQLYPVATTETVLYTCATSSVVISSLTVCNTSASADTITVRINVGGAANDNKQFLISGTSVAANSLAAFSLGLTMANTDVIKVTSTNGTCTFQLFGQENS